jgi:hypothetical protein
MHANVYTRHKPNSTSFLLHDDSYYLERKQAMGEGWELRSLAYDAPIWPRFLPTTLQRPDATVLLNFGGFREVEGFDLLAR